MLNYLSILTVLISVVSAQAHGSWIPTNGTEMRNLTNTEIWERFYVNINYTSEKVNSSLDDS